MLTRREASTPRLRLGVLASLLVNIALKLHSEESKYTSATPRCTCFPPRATSTQVPLVQVQVPKSNSALPRWTWGLGLGLGGLERSQWWAPRATSAQVPLVQVQVPKSNSASPRWTWGLGLGLGGLERSRPSPPPPAVGLIPKLYVRYISVSYQNCHLLLYICQVYRLYLTLGGSLGLVFKMK